MKKAIFFDRDGTLIVDRVFLNDPAGIEYMPGVFEALRSFRDQGFVLLVATNQSGIPRGLVQVEKMDAIHAQMRHDFARHGVYFGGFYYAPFLTTSSHMRRKPNPGMLLDGAQDFAIDLSKSWMIGDRMTDVEAGHRAGTRTVLLYGGESPEGSEFAKPEAYLPNLLEAADFISRHS